MYQVTVQSLMALPQSYVAAVQRAARLTLVACEVERGAEVTLALTDEAHIRRLNRDFRGVDAATDVLSFEATEPLPEGGVYLGDVAIALPVAQAQAQEQGNAVEAELALLTIHGVLHLLGYDHGDDETKGAMWAMQTALLGKLGLQATPTER